MRVGERVMAYMPKKIPLVRKKPKKKKTAVQEIGDLTKSSSAEIERLHELDKNAQS